MNQGYTILLVEDDMNDVQFVRQIVFQQLPETVFMHAASFGEAKTLIKEHRSVIDACLLDLTLPDLSSDELIDRMMDLVGFIPLIILTRSTDVEMGASVISKGVSDLLLKDELTPLLLQKSILYSIERSIVKRKLYESEQRYSALFFHSPHPQWLFDVTDRQITKANNAAILKYGFSEEDFRSMRISDLKPPELYDQALSLLLANNELNKVVYLGRFRHLTKDQSQLFVDMYASPLQINERNLRLIMAVDLTDRMYLEEAVKQAAIDAQDRERYELGAELHDNVKQILAAGELSLDFYMETTGEKHVLLEQAKEMFRRSISEVRALSHRLAPVIFEGNLLKLSIEKLVDQYKHSGIVIDVQFSNKLLDKNLNQSVQHNLFRITQEQLNNALKHSQAENIRISFREERNKYVFCIRDNGVGFDVKRISTFTGIGFRNIERRAKSVNGELKIKSEIGKGSCLRIIFDQQTI
jgi:PAS domain S-box-containing protein